MANQVTVGNRKALLDAHGQALAADVRAARAPNQRSSQLLPPETVGRPKIAGRGADRQVVRTASGAISQERSQRYNGANAVILRREMQRRGISDPRFITVERAGMINRENKVSQPILKPGAQGIELASSPNRGTHEVHLRHEKAEMGFDERGNKAMRAAGSDRFDEKGQPVTEERRLPRRHETYLVYSVTDVNVANLGDRTPPGQGRSQVERWKQENPGKEPDFAQIRAAMVERKMDGALKVLSERHGVQVTRDVPKLDEARFSLDKEGRGRLQIPAASAFRDLNHQTSSIMHAVSHSSLAREAQRLVAAAPEGQPDKAAAERVAAYQLPPSKQLKSPAFAEADLVASYASLQQTTGVGMTYEPPPTIKDAEMSERWAAKLQTPDGWADVDRQITRTNSLTDELKPAIQRFPTREQYAQRDQAGASARDIQARAAAAVRRDRTTVDDPSVEPPRQRPGAAPAPGGAAQQRGQTQATDKAGSQAR